MAVLMYNIYGCCTNIIIASHFTWFLLNCAVYACKLNEKGVKH